LVLLLELLLDDEMLELVEPDGARVIVPAGAVPKSLPGTISHPPPSVASTVSSPLS